MPDRYEQLLDVTRAAAATSRKYAVAALAGSPDRQPPHAQGVWLAGTFRPLPARQPGRQAIEAGIFAAGAEVTARFSLMNTNVPGRPWANNLGLAVRFGYGEGDAHVGDLLALNMPVLPTRTTDGFQRLVDVLGTIRGSLAPGERPQVGENEVASAAGVLALLRTAHRGQPRSFAEATYHCMHAFRAPLRAADGESAVRITWVPAAGDRTRRPVATGGPRAGGAWTGDDASLLAELEIRVKSPIVFTMTLQVAPPGVDLSDLSTPWPETARRLVAGELRLTTVLPQGPRFDPWSPPGPFTRIDGDELMLARRHVYALAQERARPWA